MKLGRGLPQGQENQEKLKEIQKTVRKGHENIRVFGKSQKISDKI